MTGNKIRTTWSTDGCSMITFEYEGERVTLNSGSLFNIPSRIKYYNIIAGWMIKEYISHRKWEKEPGSLHQATAISSLF